MKDLISIIVPAYNIESHVEECIDSILSQSYTHFELIIVDDGSTDNTMNKCNAYDYDERVKVIHIENGGASAARNKGLQFSQGEYICFIDGDDSIDKDYLEKMYSIISADSSIDIISCCCKTMEGNKINRFYSGNRLFENDKDDLFCQLFVVSYGQPGPTYTGIGVPWGKLYRKKLLDDNNLTFDLKLRRMQDNVFNMECFSAADKVIYIDETLYNYRLGHLEGYSKQYKKNYADQMNEVAFSWDRIIRELKIQDYNKVEKYFSKGVLDLLVGILLNEGELGKSFKTYLALFEKEMNLPIFSENIDKLSIQDMGRFKKKVELVILKKHLKLSFYIIAKAAKILII